MLSDNPCLHCGACCAHYRVSFYWSEADPTLGGTVPSELTEDVSEFLCCMRGTNQKNPRCEALSGDLCQNVHCGIYNQRSSTCKDFGIHWINGHVIALEEELERCNKARKAWNLPPLHFARAGAGLHFQHALPPHIPAHAASSLKHYPLDKKNFHHTIHSH
jgi:uncharacterized protein